MNLIEMFENNFDCYTEVDKSKGIEEEMAMSKGKFLEVVEHILHQANEVKASDEPALPIQNVIGRYSGQSRTEIQKKFVALYGDTEMAKEKANSFAVGFGKACDMIVGDLNAL